MKLKTLPLLALSFGVLSGCTNSCQGDKTPTPSTEQSAVSEPAADAPAAEEAPASDSVAATAEESENVAVAEATDE